jgi:2-aminoadipate transaminase
LPEALVEPVLTAKGNLDFGSPNFNQVLMATVMEKGLFDAHLNGLREGYRTKVEATLRAANNYLAPLSGVHWIRPTGGLYMWLTVPEHIDTGVSGRLFDQAVREGMLYVPGEFCYPLEGPAVPRNKIRLSFGVPSCDEIRRGIEALARAISQVAE